MSSLKISLEEIIEEIRSRFDLDQTRAAPMLEILKQWEEASKPADEDVFNAAARARKELQNIVDIYTEEDIERWAASTGLSKRDLFNALGASLAVAYHSHKIEFEFCDRVVNELVRYVYSGFVSGPENWPILFDNIYLAFDSGEYYRVGEEGQDPSEIHTRPAIAWILDQDETKTILDTYALS